ncbi:lipase 1 [Coniella lustricola]|uniref:Lipase 1 n=1 Tax=Coniella lustricola TaxID=2025994 RepID=A0A2T3ANM2_9PEZI|nr:lipase 1 [Coniella lustricola]
MQPIPPSQDPFYTATDDFKSTAPGTILRIRQAPGNLTAITGTNGSAAYDILYRTTDSRYNASYAVTTVFIPSVSLSSPSSSSSSGADPGGNISAAAALLSYQIPYDSASLDASPSYALYGPDGASWIQDIATALSLGWFVNVPDYEGPLASYGAGVQAGHATIDSIRAILNANGTHFAQQQHRHHRYDALNLSALASFLPVDTRIAMWGYSGGALASEWAAELQSSYAPEIHFDGAALGGLTPNVTSTLSSLLLNDTTDAGLIPSVLMGISSQYPELRQFLVSKLKTEGPYNVTGFLAAANMTNLQAIVTYAFQNITDYFVDGMEDLLSPLVRKIAANEIQMGYHGIPQMPIYAYKAIQDEISVVEDTDVLIDRFCAVEANILYERNTIGGHVADLINGKPSALQFLHDIFGRTNTTGFPSSGCVVRDVTVNITDSAM